MDKEAKEKIASKLAERKELDWGLLTGILQDEFREQATVALQTLAELGYRKPLDRTKLHEWGCPTGLPKGWRGRILKGSKENKPIDLIRLREIEEILSTQVHGHTWELSSLDKTAIAKQILALIVPKDKQHEQKGARAFLRLPVEERRKILAIQAQNLADNKADSHAKEDSKMMD